MAELLDRDRKFTLVAQTSELCPKLGDDGVREAAYRGGWKPA
jgi:hypothetical protein